MTISLRVWKIFCNKQKEKKVVSAGQLFFSELYFQTGWAFLIVSVFLNNWAFESQRFLQFKFQLNAALVLLFIFFRFHPYEESRGWKLQ